MPWWRPAPIDPQVEIALTNFVLAQLRPILRVRCEAYVKWHMARAFNGAAYECEGDATDVLFLRETPKAGAYRFGRGSVQIGSEGHDRAAVEAVLASSQAAFKALRAAEPDRLQAAARLQVWVGYRSSAATAVQDLHARAERLAGLTGGTFAISSPFEFPIGESEWNGDIDIALPAPIPEAALRAKLGAFFSGLDEPLFGFGGGGSNHGGGHSPDDALLYAHFTARQF